MDLPESREGLGHVGVYTDVSGLCVTLLMVDVYILTGFEPCLLRYAKFTMRMYSYVLITEINGTDIKIKTNLSQYILSIK